MFTMRTTKPANNKYYITLDKGGWNNAIQGYPTDKTANVLANCVGYANGRFAEIQAKNKCTYQLVCNAENFIESAKNKGLKVSDVPVLGGIMVWQGGSTLSGSDGAGHVAVVEKILELDKDGAPCKIYTSESSYGSTAFFNSTRANTNGRWGMASGFKFRGCIINPACNINDQVTPNVARNENVNQLQVLVDQLRVRIAPGTSKDTLGYATKGYYNYYETKTADNYTWYRIATNQWVAYDKEWETILPRKETEVEILKRQVEKLSKNLAEETQKNEQLNKQVLDLQNKMKQINNLSKI